MALSIAVVTRRAGVTLTLSNQSHHLVEVRPSGDWLTRDWVEDVVVLDLESAAATSQALKLLRRDHGDLPIVVISGGGGELSSSELDRVLQVPLPMTATTLLATVDDAASLARARHEPVASAPLPVTHSVGALDIADRVPQVVPTGPRRGLPDKAPSPDDRARDDEPTRRPPLVDEDRVDTTTRDSAAAAIHLVRDLLPVASLLPRVPETADVIRRRAVAAIGADASCLLVQDEDVWRVASGAGLRPLEERLQITDDHWLVSEIAFAGRGVLIRNTDVVRNQLAGSPLASWPDLLAAPIRPSGSILLLARRTPAFSRQDLEKLSAAIADVQDLLLDAVVARRLARELLPLVDPVD